MKNHSRRSGACVVCGRTRTIDGHHILSWRIGGDTKIPLGYSCHDAIERIDMETNWLEMLQGLFQVWDAAGQEGRLFLLKAAILCVQAVKRIHEDDRRGVSLRLRPDR